MEKLPPYQQMNDIFLENRIFLEAAEAHGLLCGLLVCNTKTTAETWITIMTNDPDAWNKINFETQKELEDFCQLTLNELRDPDFRFELLIPSDTDLLAERARALGLWCKGFVTGVEHHGNYLGELMGRAQDEVDDALADLQSIAEVDYNVTEYEEHEKAFTSVIEYVRIAVLLVQRELSGNATSSASGSTSIH